MIGDAWNTLVAPPTDRELDAAMAEVRVRAIGHARRGARRGRVISLAGISMALTLAVLGGRSMGSGLRLYEQYQIPAADDLQRAVFAPVAGPARGRPAALHRYHVVLTTEMNGEVIAQGEAWVEGPNGTSFRLRAHHESEFFMGEVIPSVYDDSVSFFVAGTVTHDLGFTKSGRRVTETGQVGHRVQVANGSAAVLYPFGRSNETDVPRTSIRMEGPSAAPAPDGVAWRSADRDTAGGWSYLASLRAAGSTEAARHGVRYAVRNIGALEVSVQWLEPPVRVRVAVPGGEFSSWAWAQRSFPWSRLHVPGVAKTIELATQPVMGRAGESCVQLSYVPDPGRADRWGNGGCFASGSNTMSLTVVGQAFVVERAP